jgi:replication factor C subunit 1
MNLWFEKYRPRSLDDIVISDIKKNALIEWFTKFQIGETTECAVLFTGPPGLGKTSLAHILLDAFGYKAKEFNASDIRSKALVRENLNGLINIADVTSVTRMNNRPVGIIMDEVDGMFKGDRGGIEELLSYISIPSKRKQAVNNNLNRKVPIICICNIGSVKKEVIKNLKKECFEVSFSLPDKKSLSKVVDRISEGEGMTITDDAVTAIIDYSQGDYRRLISIMEFLYVTCGKVIDTEQVESCYDVLTKKVQDLHITDSIRCLINNMLDGHTVHTIYDGDKSKAPMVVHQNYLQAISLQKAHAMTKIDNATKCMDSLIVSDIIEKTMYNTQCWYLQPIQGYTCAMIPNYYINNIPKSGPVTASWASVLSVSSQSQNLRKNMYNEIYGVDREHSYSIEDIQVIIETVFDHLINGNTERAVHMLLDYNLTELDECLLPGCKKKTLLIIDKIAKYIKISPYYKRWIKFRDSHKGIKELDQQIKDCVTDYSKGTRVTKDTKLSNPFYAFSRANRIKPIIKDSSKPKLRPVLIPRVAPVPVFDRKLKPVMKSKQRKTVIIKKRSGPSC